MATATSPRLQGASRAVDRALRHLEEITHSLRQKLLARQIARVLPPDEWTPTAEHESLLSAEDLRQRAAELRTSKDG